MSQAIGLALLGAVLLIWLGMQRWFWVLLFGVLALAMFLLFVVMAFASTPQHAIASLFLTGVFASAGLVIAELR